MKILILLLATYSILPAYAGIEGSGGGFLSSAGEYITIHTCNNEDMQLCTTTTYRKEPRNKETEKENNNTCFIQIGEGGLTPCPPGIK